METQYTPLIVPMSISSSEETIDVSMSSSIYVEPIKDYDPLINKPQINGVELSGNKTAYELNLAYKIKYDTTEGWTSNRDYVPLEGEIIIYTDYAETGDGVNVPGIKIGDGMAYAVDLPFVGDSTRDLLLNHIADTAIHITPAERASWNDKVRCYFYNDSIVFTTR